MELNILNCGAVADGKTLNTKYIQEAIDKVHKNGGGKVVVPAGTFLSGTIWLKSHVELHLEKGALLKASENLDDYNAEDAYRQNYGFPPEGWIGKHFIVAVEETDVSITGGGVIDGSGDSFFGEIEDLYYTGYAFRYGVAFSKKDSFRPGQTLCIIESRDVTIRDVSIVNSPCWCFFIHGSENVSIHGIRVKNLPYHANTDGIDIDASKNVIVSDCIIDTGDDAIAIRCAGYRIREDLDVCENITITNCVMTARSSGVRISVGRGTIRNVTMSNLVIREASPAINVATAYNGKGKINVENLLISNVIADDVGRPISIRESNSCSIKNVTITSFTARAMCQCFICAEDKGAIRNITLRDVNVELFDSDFVRLEGYNLTHRGEYALSLEGADDVRMYNVRMNPEKTDMKLYYEKDCCNTTKENCNF